MAIHPVFQGEVLDGHVAALLAMTGLKTRPSTGDSDIEKRGIRVSDGRAGTPFPAVAGGSEFAAGNGVPALPRIKTPERYSQGAQRRGFRE